MAVAPDPNEVLRSTTGKANFQRVTRLLISGGTTLLWEIFDLNCPPSNLPKILNNPATEKQLKSAKLTKPQWDCLYPSPGVYGKSTDFDITLLFRLLRTICGLVPPSTGWDTLPTSTDHTLTADLARIKYYRNSVYGHVNQNMEITDDEFPRFWQEIGEALVRIAGQISPTKKQEWQEAINNCLKDPLTAEDERNVQELLRWYRNDMEIKESIEELKSSIQDGVERLETSFKGVKRGIAGMTQVIEEKGQCVETAIREETKDIKDQLREVNQSIHRLEALLRVRIDCETISGSGSRGGCSESVVTSHVPQAGVQRDTVVPITSCQQQALHTAGQFTEENARNEGISSAEAVLNFIAFKYFQAVDPSKPEELNGYLEYLKEVRKVLFVDTQLGSLVITVECRSLEILEGLWEDYCSGYLNEMAQKFLVTDDILKEFGLIEVTLTTTILKEQYRSCREHFLQRLDIDSPMGLEPSHEMTERDIHESQLPEHIGDKWRDLARTLYYSQAVIDAIQKEQGNSTKECCIAILVRWMDQEGRDATVGKLTEALTRIELKSVADRLIGPLPGKPCVDIKDTDSSQGSRMRATIDKLEKQLPDADKRKYDAEQEDSDFEKEEKEEGISSNPLSYDYRTSGNKPGETRLSLQKRLREMEQKFAHVQELREKELQEFDLYAQLKQKDKQVENAQRQLREMEEQLRAEKGEQEENLQRHVREMEQQLTNLKERFREKGEETSKLQQQVTTLEGQLRAKKQELNELDITLKTALQSLDDPQPAQPAQSAQRQQSPDWVIPGDQIQLTKKCLGWGAWGKVVEGKYCGCAVAVKQIHELILSPHNRSLFKREMDIASRCRHPCLLQFIGATNDEGSPLFVTELMETSLRALLELQPLSTTEVSIISLDVARALNYLHHKEPSPIIHRDISSANVLLWRQGDQWRGKVSDYGTAKFMQQTMTVVVEAPLYLAPEARKPQNQTVKIDVYSFGVLLCEMCIRELPDPERRGQQVAMVTNRLLRVLILRCLQPEPATRPSMEEIVEELQEPA